MPRVVYLKLECLADEEWQAKHQSRTFYPQCPSWRAVVEAIEQGEENALDSCVRCSKARIVPSMVEPYPHQSRLGIEDKGKGLSVEFHKSFSQDEDYHYLAESDKLYRPYHGYYDRYYLKGSQATIEPPKVERVTIADAIERVSSELSQALDEVEQGIYEFGDIDNYEPSDEETDEYGADREQVKWLKELKSKLERYLDQIEVLELDEYLLTKEMTFSWKQVTDKPFAGGYSINALKAIAQRIGTPKEQGRMFGVSDKSDSLIQIASELEGIEYR